MEEERKRHEEETFWSVFLLPILVLLGIVGAIIGLIVWAV